jgi:hypothetical protein
MVAEVAVAAEAVVAVAEGLVMLAVRTPSQTSPERPGWQLGCV